jgi:tRNA threonylcarbamoyladenosine biosynthesis protein TsaE
MEDEMLVLETKSAADTQALGEKLAALLQDGDVLALIGDLGAGKTAFTQGLGRALGIRQAITSPTFTLINQYRTAHQGTLQHVDCYRLSNATAEMWDVGLTDLFAGDDIVVIEWADRIQGLLPTAYLELSFVYLAENRRRVSFRAHGARYETLLAQLAALTPEKTRQREDTGDTCC